MEPHGQGGGGCWWTSKWQRCFGSGAPHLWSSPASPNPLMGLPFSERRLGQDRCHPFVALPKTNQRRRLHRCLVRTFLPEVMKRHEVKRFVMKKGGVFTPVGPLAVPAWEALGARTIGPHAWLLEYCLALVPCLPFQLHVWHMAISRYRNRRAHDGRRPAPRVFT